MDLDDLFPLFRTQWFFFAAIVAVAGLVAAALLGLIASYRPEPSAVLPPLLAAEPPPAAAALPVVALPATRDREQILPELLRAGFYKPTALAEYQTFRAFLILIPILIAGIAVMLVEPARIPLAAGAGLFGALVGYSAPRAYVGLMAQRRRREVERGLPIAVDLIALGVMAGQNVLAAFGRSAGEMRRSFPTLSNEMRLVLRQAELNTLPHSLQIWADRCGVPEVATLAIILGQSEKLGTDIAAALTEFSNNFRVNLRQRADAQANRAELYILFPTIFFLWIPAAVLLAAPIYMEFWSRRELAREAIRPSGADPKAPLEEQFAPFTKGPAQPAPVAVVPDGQ